MAIIHVTANQTPIQAGINTTSPGDTILVAPGTYNEKVTINKSVTVASSSGPALTIIHSPADENHLASIKVDNVVLNGNYDPSTMASDIYVQGNDNTDFFIIEVFLPSNPSKVTFIQNQ